MTDARDHLFPPTGSSGPENSRVIVIGAGAGGMMAAGRAAERGADVLLLEKTDSPGKKIRVSGKGRCNLTNSRGVEDFLAMYGPNGRFLRNAFHCFFREDLTDFLRRYGVETKIERGGRVFPVSDDATDVVAAFRHYLKEGRVKLRCGSEVTAIAVRGGSVEGVRVGGEVLPARAVILAAGDRMLVEATAIIRKLLRDIDVFGRIGGEEFAILLPETDLAGGMATAERLRAAIERTTIDAGNQALKVTISIGVALLAREDRGLETVLKRADDAMYEAKRRGRNRVVADPTLPAPAGAVDVVRR